LKELVDFLDGKLSQKPAPKPQWLDAFINDAKLPIEELALTTLAPILDRVHRGWGESDKRSAAMLLEKELSETLRDHLARRQALINIKGRIKALVKNKTKRAKKERRDLERLLKEKPRHIFKYAPEDLLKWTPEQIIEVGNWMLRVGAMNLNCFIFNSRGVPELVPNCHMRLDGLRELLMRRNQVLLPFDKEPPDWTGFRKRYGDGWFERTFVRDFHPVTEKEIDETFQKNPFYHAYGLNELKRVPFLIDPVILSLVEKYGIEEQIRRIPKGKNKKQRQKLIEAIERDTRDDCRMARMTESKPFWLDYSCDFRGRIYAVQNLHYGRGDCVRALFKFVKGVRLTEKGLSWLEVHCANSHGATDKESFDERRKWVDNKRDKIREIAADPFGTFKNWRKADKPFAYVAACIELTQAWDNPNGFKTHLPVPFDGSNNGIQHLALIIRDEDAARRVNLIRSETPQDIYFDVATQLKKIVEEDDGKHASWWQKYFKKIDKKEIRKICKTPVMAFGYGITTPKITLEVWLACQEIGKGHPPKGACRYLAKKIEEACKELLQGPIKVKRYIRDLAQHCCDKENKKDRIMRWVSPSGFPCANRYLKPNVRTVSIGSGALRVRRRIAEGWSDEILRGDAIDGAMANFVHSMDAAHLIFIVLAMTEPWRKLKTSGDIVTVHDCFACHAPDVDNLKDAIRLMLWMMYRPNAPVPRGGLPSVSADRNHLADLRRANVNSDDILPCPTMGSMNVDKVRNSKYDWH
jgi:DNA-dependent RNA polymerase